MSKKLSEKCRNVIENCHFKLEIEKRQNPLYATACNILLLLFTIFMFHYVELLPVLFQRVYYAY
jgi:hypothetical protein